jgi:DNA-binding SARP family transcriptional activator
LTGFTDRRRIDRVGIGLLGPLIVGDGTALEPRDRIALSVLAVRRGQIVSPDELADALWGESPPATWPKQVHPKTLAVRRTFDNSPGAELRVVEGAQHFMSASNPGDVNLATAEFIERWK